MPGCYLQIAGAQFDPDAFLAGCSLEPYSVWRVGEPLADSGPRSTRFHEWAGFRCNVSDVEGDLEGQIADAVTFLARHRDDLLRLASDPSVEDRRLDFGFDCRLGVGNVAVQCEWLPVDFLSTVAELRIGVALSLYAPLQPNA